MEISGFLLSIDTSNGAAWYTLEREYIGRKLIDCLLNFHQDLLMAMLFLQLGSNINNINNLPSLHLHEEWIAEEMVIKT